MKYSNNINNSRSLTSQWKTENITFAVIRPIFFGILSNNQNLNRRETSSIFLCAHNNTLYILNNVVKIKNLVLVRENLSLEKKIEAFKGCSNLYI